MDFPSWYPKYRELRNRKDMGLPLRPEEETQLNFLETKLLELSNDQEKNVATNASKLIDATGGKTVEETIAPEASKKFVKSLDSMQELPLEQRPAPLPSRNDLDLPSDFKPHKPIFDPNPEIHPKLPRPYGLAPDTPPRGEPIPLAQEENFPPGSTYQVRRDSRGTSGTGGGQTGIGGQKPDGPWALEATTQVKLSEIRDAIKALAANSARGGVVGRNAPSTRQSDIEADEEREQPDSIDRGLTSGIRATNPYMGGLHFPRTNRLLRRTRAVYRGIGKVRQWITGNKGAGTTSPPKGMPPPKTSTTPVSPRTGLPVATPVGNAGAATATGARAGGALAAGGTAEAGAAAAAGGPISLAAAGVVVLGMAAVEAAKQVYSFARAQESEIRKLSEVGGVQAAAIAQLDVGRQFRDIKTAGETGQSSQELINALNKFENALQPIEAILTNLANKIGADALNVLENLLPIIENILRGIYEIYNILPWRAGNKDMPTLPTTAYDTIDRMQAEQDRQNRPHWPQGPVGNTPMTMGH